MTTQPISTPQQLDAWMREFKACFAPAEPPQGWETLLLENADWAKFDRQTDQTISRVDRVFQGFLENMTVYRPCECHIYAAQNGFKNRPCSQQAEIGDVELELDFSRDCYRKLQQGEWL